MVFFFKIGYLDSDPLQGNHQDNKLGSRLLAEEVNVEMTCKVVIKQVEKQSVAMDEASGIWAKIKLLKRVSKSSLNRNYCGKIFYRLHKMFKKTCPGK